MRRLRHFSNVTFYATIYYVNNTTVSQKPTHSLSETNPQSLRNQPTSSHPPANTMLSPRLKQALPSIPQDHEGKQVRAAEIRDERGSEVMPSVGALDRGVGRGSAGIPDIGPFVEPLRDNGPYGWGDRKDNEVLFDVEVQVQEPQRVVLQRSDTTSSYQSNPYTLGALTSVWGARRDKFRSGYDGRDVRKKNFEEEMADGGR
jgi:hypothetical protein